MSKKKILSAVFIVIFGVIFRILLNEKVGIPNFEAVTAISLVSGSFLGGIFAPVIPLLIMFLSDIYFGNTSIYLFTWSAFILIGIFGLILKRNSKFYSLKITGLGILSVLFFYLWTNFGWWLVSGMYPMNFQGLIRCYIAALPFLRNQIGSVLIFAPSFSLIFFFILNKFTKKLIQAETKKHENFTFISKIS